MISAVHKESKYNSY